MKKIFASLVLFLIASLSWAFELDEMREHLYPDNHVGFYYFDFGSKTEVAGGVSSFGSGLYIETGFNPFVWLNKGLIIAPFIGISPVWGADYSPSFRKDLETYYRRSDEYVDLLAIEAAGEESLTDAQQRTLDLYSYGDIKMNVMMAYPMQGSWSWYYGIVFRLPFTYMPVIKAYVVNHYISITSSGTGWVVNGTEETAGIGSRSASVSGST